MGRARIDLRGQTFGRLTVRAMVASNSAGQSIWACQCACGELLSVAATHLRRGAVKSCGCLRRELGIERLLRSPRRTHGATETVEYETWQRMIQRCTNPNSEVFEYYGGRGITVCERWRKSFENFRADMGLRPEGMSIDRKDVNGNYEPTNCRWATAIEQRLNQRRMVAA